MPAKNTEVCPTCGKHWPSTYAAALGRRRKGVKEKRSEKKRAAMVVIVQLSVLRRAGRHEEADALYAATWPEKAATRELRRLSGLAR